MDALQRSIDQTVKSVHAGNPPLSQALLKLRDAWEDSCPAQYGLGINLSVLGDALSDRTLIEQHGADFVISDAIRVIHARHQLQRAFCNYNPFHSPNFHGSYIISSDGRTALLISLEGYDFEPYGVFVDLAQFEAAVHSEGYLLASTTRDFED